MSSTLNSNAVYWQATRAFSAPASIVPVAVGAAAAVYLHGRSSFDPIVFALTLAGAILAHFGANVINDYFDFINGVDIAPEHGSGVLTTGRMTRKQAFAFGSVLLTVAALCGAALYPRAPYAVVTLSLIGLACAVLYPAILKRFALGDFLIVTAFGVGLTLGSYIVQTGDTSPSGIFRVIVISLPVASLVDAILHANNLRDVDADRAAHVTTIATILSPQGGRVFFAILIFLPLAFTLVAPLLNIVPIWSVIALVSIQPLLNAYRSENVPLTAQSHLAFGIPYALSFLIKPIFGH